MELHAEQDKGSSSPGCKLATGCLAKRPRMLASRHLQPFVKQAGLPVLMQ